MEKMACEKYEFSIALLLRGWI